MTAPAAHPMIPAIYRVARVRKETRDTVTLTVAPAGGEAHGFAPGQFSMLWVFGVGELPISISGDPGERGELVYTVRSVGQATHALVSRKPGESLGVRGPFGSSWPVESAEGRDVLVMAGGIGLAPLRPVVYHVLRHRGNYGRLTILYGARTPKDLLYRREMASWVRKPDTSVLTTVDSGDLNWRGHVGVVTALLRFMRLDTRRTVAMVCGPEIMMRYATRELTGRGLVEDDIHLSLERNMKCAIGSCGHCQLGPYFICKDGPVFRYGAVRRWLATHEL